MSELGVSAIDASEAMLASAGGAENGSATDAAREMVLERGFDIDAILASKLEAFHSNRNLMGLGQQVLEYGVSNPFLNGEISFRAPPSDGLITDASRESIDMLGADSTKAGVFDDPAMNSLVEGMKTMYFESAKTLLAWNIVHQVSKDTKIMLQAQ